MANYTHYVGRVASDPEVTTTGGGKRLAKFRFVAETGWDKASGKQEKWFDVAAWEADADIAALNINKGMRVWLYGTESLYTTGSGVERPQLSVREMGSVNKFAFSPPATYEVKSPKAKAKPEPKMEGIDDDDDGVEDEW